MIYMNVKIFKLFKNTYMCIREYDRSQILMYVH